MKALVAFSFVLTVFCQPDISRLPDAVPDKVILRFQEFQTKYNKRYDNQEEQFYRALVFQNNKAKINNHNGKGRNDYYLGEN